MVTLVCGMPGTGKTTWVKERLGDGLCYDLDAIAAAFRLRGPHEEYHDASRHMANDLFHGFTKQARLYSHEIFIIRTAPGPEEFEAINPDQVVICVKRYVHRPHGMSAMNKLYMVEDHCKKNGIPIEYVF